MCIYFCTLQDFSEYFNRLIYRLQKLMCKTAIFKTKNRGSPSNTGKRGWASYQNTRMHLIDTHILVEITGADMVVECRDDAGTRVRSGRSWERRATSWRTRASSRGGRDRCRNGVGKHGSDPTTHPTCGGGDASDEQRRRCGRGQRSAARDSDRTRQRPPVVRGVLGKVVTIITLIISNYN
jgi:hypothetical protein